MQLARHIYRPQLYTTSGIYLRFVHVAVVLPRTTVLFLVKPARLVDTPIPSFSIACKNAQQDLLKQGGMHEYNSARIWRKSVGNSAGQSQIETNHGPMSRLSSYLCLLPVARLWLAFLALLGGLLGKSNQVMENVASVPIG